MRGNQTCFDGRTTRSQWLLGPLSGLAWGIDLWPGLPEGSSPCPSLPGATCEVVLAPCAPGPCRNGGECRESEDYESFSCACPTGWQGESRGWGDIGRLGEARGPLAGRGSPGGWGDIGRLGEARGPRTSRVSPGGWGGEARRGSGATGWQGEPRGRGDRGGEGQGLQATLASESPSLGDEPVGCRVLPGLKICLLLGPKSGGSPLESPPSLDAPRGSPCDSRGPAPGGRAVPSGYWLSQRLPRPLPQGRPARSTSTSV